MRASLSEELTQLSAAEIAALVRRRAASPVEVLEAHLVRIERLNPRLNAVVTLAPDALDVARAAEAALSRGEDLGPLAGVPFTVKETIETVNLRTTFGSRVFAEHVPRFDAPAVARLRAAGAILLGKTNVSEFALDYTADNSVFGRTNNPFDERLTPGGSSGGCAAAVCACMTAAGLGSDMTGSVRVPAHFCGVAALRPTAGRVPGAGHLPPIEGPYALGASLGPIARRVEDLALLFDVLVADDVDRIKYRFEGDEPDDSIADLKGRRIACYVDDGSVRASDETRAAVEAAARALEDAGLVSVDERPPHVGRATELWLSLFSKATQEFIGGTYRGREGEAGPIARLMLERAANAKPTLLHEYFDAWRARDRLRAELLEWMAETPLLVAPVGAVAAFPHDTRKVAAAGGETLGVFRAFGYAQAFNVFDLPAACVRAGWTGDGRPVGVQIVGRPRAEREVLAAARIVEQALGGWRGVPENLSQPGGNSV